MRACHLQLVFVGALAIVVTAMDLASAQSKENSQYNHRESAEYRELDSSSQEKLDRVVKDFSALEKALKGFMADHHDQLPETLDELVPKYLKSLPKDPFASSSGASSSGASSSGASSSGASSSGASSSGASSSGASPQKPARDEWKHTRPSLGGAGYLYQRRPGSVHIVSWKPTIQWRSQAGSWRIRSIGLPDFPLRYASKNGRGLVRSQGYWGRMILDVF